MFRAEDIGYPVRLFSLQICFGLSVSRFHVNLTACYIGFWGERRCFTVKAHF